ncbi:uncharacterized protein C1orf131 homolog isoform X2 [Erinaceus europaeus]|uniref:Uncharacterized protein C1orf131 homolog isoform X2 n=1 Tax=Erinaceus europaeus TaxID=9365 RepID=A0ABM3XGN2_ERIEU|nr:uncharacterized protein C1orf131 homolog isoform X2 [Erinaceus europaeus]
MAGNRSASPTSPGSETRLDALLQNLYDFGEIEEPKQKNIKKKREDRKRDVGAPLTLIAEPASIPESLTRDQKKSASNFFKELREELQCASAVVSTGFPSGLEVPGAAVSSLPLKNNREQIEVIEFHSRNKNKKQKLDQNESTKARLEVHRFGISGYGKGKERVLEQERAVMLGAKPPKNSYVNYKLLQEKIKEKKDTKEEEKRMVQNTDIFKRKKRKVQKDGKSVKKKSAPSILSSGRAGQVGKFKNGTLVLSQVDIKKINSSRVTKRSIKKRMVKYDCMENSYL